MLSSVSALFSVSAASEGDINADGNIDLFDCMVLKRAICGLYTLNSSEKSKSDINSDGIVDTLDYFILKRMVLGTLNSEISITRKTAVSYGKTYTTSLSASSAYPDTYNSELTDGAVSSSAGYTNGAFSGYEGTVDVVINLGSDGVDLSGFELSYLSVDEAGILPPASVSVYGSDRADSVGDLLVSLAVPSYSSTEVASVSYNLSSYVNYSYIRFRVESASHWLFIDECIVYAQKTVDATQNNAVTPQSAYLSDTVTDEIRNSNVDSVYSGNGYNKNLGLNLISGGRTAKINAPAGIDSRCSSVNASALTDKTATGSAYDSGNWYGINAASASYVEIDLSSVYYNLCAFSLHVFNRDNSQISLPAYTDVEVSSDGYSFTNIGRIYAPDTDSENHVFTLSLDTLIMARYIRFKLPENVGYYWIEEAEVYQNAASSDSYLYGDFEMTFSDNASYWRASASDYNRYQNLIFGISPEIKSGTELRLADYYQSNGSEADAYLLTDGENAQGLDCYSDPWFGFYSGEERCLFFDMGNISAVSEFSVSALRNDDWAIVLPDSVQLILSENGDDWFVAGELSLSGNDVSASYSSKRLAATYRARYAIIRFEVTSYYVFLDEITVSGTKNIDGAVSLSGAGLPEFEVPDDTVYTKPSDDLLGGAEDVLLIYHNMGRFTEDVLLPYVAYVDKNGNITDTMYDGFLFLISPGSGYLPSGGTPYGTNTAADWKFLHDQLFASNINFDALNKATGKVKSLLNMPDYKVKVFVTIPHLDSSLYGDRFGDIDGDGVNEDLRYLNNRVSVAKYYVEKVTATFASKGYDNIEIGGFYWFHETIARYSDDAKTAQALNAELDKMGVDLFWIPYYQATGYNYWKEYGFDAAFYQPNYAFNASVDESRLEEVANQAMNLGMSIEMEIDPSALSDLRYFRKYMDYLRGGVVYGYMDNAVNMFYQNFDDIGTAADSDNARVRLIYDYTYLFIKDALDISPDIVSPLSFEAKSDTSCSATVDSGSGSALEYKIAVSPEHGSLAFDSDGDFVYYPNKGFTGTDTFTYKVGNYLGWSRECTVTITVE